MAIEDASIPISGRFQRIENALARIEEKLEVKANLSDVSRIETRVVALENGTSPYNQRLIQDFFSTQQNVASLQLESSKNLPLLASIPDLDNRLNALESTTKSSQAVTDAINASKQNSIRLRTALIGVTISALAGLGGLAVSLINLIRH